MNNSPNSKELPESVYFYTFHKCASTLFSGFVLKHAKGLEHVDYASGIFSGVVSGALKFEDRGALYGPIRLSADPAFPVYEMLVAPTSNPDFIRNKIAVFLIRDPRDILISSYYSFGYSHGLSSVEEIRKTQERIRDKIHASSLDEYVLDHAAEVSGHFKVLSELDNACNRSVILKYEDMVENYEYFAGQLSKYLCLDEDVIREIYRRSRPRPIEDISSHRRSGQVGGYKQKLGEQTIESLNKKLGPTLSEFGYGI